MNTSALRRIAGPLVIALSLAVATPATAQITTRSGSAADVAGITPIRDQFRVDLGGGTVAGANGLFGGIRREINWDGVPATFAAPNNLPSDFFNVNSPRGALFSTAGTGFMVSSATTDAGAGQPALANFGNINSSYTVTFAPFSPQRLFTAVGSNVLDVTFVVPGTNTPAVTNGFGAIFSDVDQAGTTAIQFFDINDVSLGAFAAPPSATDNGFSFLGMFITNGTSQIHRVRITNGNTELGANNPDNGSTREVVAMDDFLYGNPVAVPEPATIALLATGLVMVAAYRRRALKARRQ